MNTSKWLSVATGVSVFLVAAFAFTQSFMHIFALGASHGQIGASGPLLPLSVDGLLISMSFIMLYCAWQKLSVPWLARVMLWLGILATIAANVGYGLAFGYIGALTSCWPAVAFIGSVETLLQLGKIKRKKHKDSPKKDRPSDVEIMTGRSMEEWQTPSYADPDVTKIPTKGALKASAYHDITGKLPSIRSIRAELKCGQPKAMELLKIMREEHCGLDKAIRIREEMKQGG